MSRIRWRPPVQGLVLAALAALCLAAGARPAQGLEVQRVLWGFDGRAVPERINLLSVQVDNPDAQAYNGSVAVYCADVTGGRLGALITHPLYVSPFASKWVQFYVYPGQRGEDWTLELDGRRQRLDGPTFGPPARVYLSEPDALSRRATDVKTFPEELFPPSVSATDGLDSVVMDHVPKWEPLKRQAFVDWLRRGGTLHLIAGPDGRFPAFSGDLSLLNQGAERFHAGAGLVVRHQADGRRFGERELAQGGFPPLELQRGGRQYETMDASLLRRLTQQVQPRHNWLLIYLVLLLYAVLVAPVNWLLSRRARSFRVPLVFFLASVLCATLVLSAIGRRGYGERQRQLSLTVARQLEGGVYDVTHWTNVFVTSGGHYNLAYPGDYAIYSTAQSSETARAVITNGVGGRMVADLPLFSSRSFLHRGRTRGPDLGVRLLEFQGDEWLQALVCRVGPQFPAGGAEARALYRGRFYVLVQQGDRLRLGGTYFQAPQQYLSGYALGIDQPFLIRDWTEDRETDARIENVMAKMMPPLVAHCLGGTQELSYYVSGGPPDDGRIRLFIYTRDGGQFGPGPAGGRQTGFVLYDLDLFPPEAPDG